MSDNVKPVRVGSVARKAAGQLGKKYGEDDEDEAVRDLNEKITELQGHGENNGVDLEVSMVTDSRLVGASVQNVFQEYGYETKLHDETYYADCLGRDVTVFELTIRWVG